MRGPAWSSDRDPRDRRRLLVARPGASHKTVPTFYHLLSTDKGFSLFWFIVPALCCAIVEYIGPSYDWAALENWICISPTDSWVMVMKLLTVQSAIKSLDARASPRLWDSPIWRLTFTCADYSRRVAPTLTVWGFGMARPRRPKTVSSAWSKTKRK